jgi:hypothetical protein
MSGRSRGLPARANFWRKTLLDFQLEYLGLIETSNSEKVNELSSLYGDREHLTQTFSVYSAGPLRPLCLNHFLNTKNAKDHKEHGERKPSPHSGVSRISADC